MMSFNLLQSSYSGLAHTLEEAPQLVAQTPAITLSSRTNNCAKNRSEQQAAIAILLDQHNDRIFAFLTFARSFHHDVPYFPGPGSLSRDQFFAVCALRDCADDEIRACLEQARMISTDSEQPQYPRRNALQNPGFTYLTSSEQTQDVLSAPGERIAFCAPVNGHQIGSSYQNKLSASSVHPQHTLNRTHTSHEANPANIFWCTICENRVSLKNLGDWRKHETKHVSTYVCMRGAPLQESAGGFECIFCGARNPSEEHLRTHNIHTCGQGLLGSYQNDRRVIFVKHLEKCHGVQEKARCEFIARQWKSTTKKQWWSCGFCIYLAPTFKDRLKHIAPHFSESGQTIDEWDTTKVMKGLLLQPGMVDAWERQLATSAMDWERSKIVWKEQLVRDLQRDLELGPSDPTHAEALAKRVYEASQLSWNLFNDNKPDAFAPNPETFDSTTVRTNDYSPAMEPNNVPNPNHQKSQFVANPAETLHCGDLARGGNPMATYGYESMSAFPSDDDGSSIKVPWLSDRMPTYPPAADQYVGYHGYQEYANATTGKHTWPSPELLRDEPNADDMLMKELLDCH